MTEKTDEDIMKLVQEGNLELSATLFRRYRVRIYNYFLKICFDKELSMDLTQSTFYRMLHYRASYKSEYTFRTWLFSIARNLFFDQAKPKYLNTTSINSVHVNKIAVVEENKDVFENQSLYLAMEALSTEDRELLVLSRFQEMKYSEIAEMQGITESAIKVKIHRAIKKLRNHYFNEEQKLNKIYKAN